MSSPEGRNPLDEHILRQNSRRRLHDAEHGRLRLERYDHEIHVIRHSDVSGHLPSEIFATLLMGLLAWRQRALWYRLSGDNTKIVSLRIVGEIGATICFITALFNMPIANATAILQVMPLAVTLAAAMFLGEEVGWRRYTAILVGFIGVMLIVRPGSDGFTIYSVYALIAVVFLTLRDITTRRLAANVPSTYVAFISALSILIMSGLLSITTPWAPASPVQMALLAIAAMFVLVGYLFGIMTMRVGDIPDHLTIIGSVNVVLTGLYTSYRERLLAAKSSKLVV